MTAADNCDDLELLATGFARARTEGVFSVLAQMFATILGASEVMVCEVSARARARADSPSSPISPIRCSASRPISSSSTP